MASSVNMYMSIAFIIGYLAIIFEYYIKVNKTASALLMAVITWVILFSDQSNVITLSVLDEHVGNASQIIFFLLGAMTLVELIDTHRGFKVITDVIFTQSKKKMMWMIGIISFFLSAVLDNLTTTIVLVSLLRKLISNSKDRALLGSAVVISSNIGGAWTPIGDVTTTMLWIKGRITTLVIMEALIIPCVVALIVTIFLLSLQVHGKHEDVRFDKDEPLEPGANIVLLCGIGSLIFVPIFKAVTGLPPFMGILVGLGLLWLITDIMHHKYRGRSHLRVPHILTKIDTSGILFFLGILLCINALEIVGILKNVAALIGAYVKSVALISTIIGVLSAIVDNVPLVAACIGMYPIESYPMDSKLWQLLAYCAGTGGSILIIGSAAGVAFMGLEKVDFIWYLKRISLTAFAGFLAGLATYIFIYII